MSEPWILEHPGLALALSAIVPLLFCWVVIPVIALALGLDELSAPLSKKEGE